jgi:hypothetical protein
MRTVPCSRREWASFCANVATVLDRLIFRSFLRGRRIIYKPAAPAPPERRLVAWHTVTSEAPTYFVPNLWSWLTARRSFCCLQQSVDPDHLIRATSWGLVQLPLPFAEDTPSFTVFAKDCASNVNYSCCSGDEKRRQSSEIYHIEAQVLNARGRSAPAGDLEPLASQKQICNNIAI